MTGSRQSALGAPTHPPSTSQHCTLCPGLFCFYVAGDGCGFPVCVTDSKPGPLLLQSWIFFEENPRMPHFHIATCIYGHTYSLMVTLIQFPQLFADIQTNSLVLCKDMDPNVLEELFVISHPHRFSGQGRCSYPLGSSFLVTVNYNGLSSLLFP